MQILSRKRCVIGEGPIWCDREKKLYHVNGIEKEICVLDVDTGESVIRKLDCGIAALAFGAQGQLLISNWEGAFFLNSDGTTVPMYDPSEFQILYGNDAKVGPDGRFYIGTQSRKRVGVGTEIDGKLYAIDSDGTVTTLLDGLKLSNGFDWSMDCQRFYHTDSDTHIIKEYAFDPEGPSLTFTGRELFVDGVDGFTIDQRDFLYIGCWGKGHIAIVDTNTMAITDYIPVPARIPASCCFAGKAMDQLVVVSANWKSDLSEDPNAGFSFIKNANTQGRSPFLFG